VPSRTPVRTPNATTMIRKSLHHLRTPLCSAALLLCLGGVAHAQSPNAASPYPQCDREPSPSDIEGAKGAHKAAELFYAKGNYDRAIQSWTDAYSFDCTAHRLLINIGNAHEKIGNKDKAIEAFETYLDRMGPDADPTIADKVENLRKLAAPQPQPQPQPVGNGDPNPIDSPPPPPDDNPEEPDEGGDSSVAPFVLMGVGGVLVVVGAVLLGVGSSKVSDAEASCAIASGGDPRNCGVGPESEALKNDGNSGRTMMGVGAVGLGLGGAAVIGGVVWWLVSGSDDNDNAQLRPMYTPRVGDHADFAGLELSGSF
jgi:hypothetical protein